MSEDKKEDTTAEEVEAFYPTEELKLASGKEIRLPKITWGKEISALAIVGQIINDIDEFQEVDFETITVSEILKLIGGVVTKAPDKVTKIVSILTDQTPEEVEENFDSENVMQVLVPFFRTRWKKVAKAFRQGGQIPTG